MHTSEMCFSSMMLLMSHAFFGGNSDRFSNLSCLASNGGKFKTKLINFEGNLNILSTVMQVMSFI